MRDQLVREIESMRHNLKESMTFTDKRALAYRKQYSKELQAAYYELGKAVYDKDNKPSKDYLYHLGIDYFNQVSQSEAS